MLINYLKTALRNFWRNKIYSLINVAGLAIGMACSIIIFLWVNNELSYDRFHQNANHIFQLHQTIFMENDTHNTEKTAGPLAQDLKQLFPEIANTTRFSDVGETLLTYKDRSFEEKLGTFADPSIFDIFTFPLQGGNAHTVLQNPYSIVLTETMAKKYFDEEEPIGKTVQLDKKYNLMVTGVLKNIPSNSSRKFDFIVPFQFLEKIGINIHRYDNTSFYTYVQLYDHVSFQETSQKIFNTFTKSEEESGIKRKYFLVPLTDSYLQGDQSPGMQALYLLSTLAVLVLIIACINFINLSTARSSHREKEVGIRKVTGARRIQLINQFLSESIITTIIASLFALVLTELFLPVLNRLSGKQIDADYLNGQFIWGFIGIIIVTAIISGGYPALVLSAFNPAKVFRGGLRSGKKSARFRKILVCTQFTFTIVFIIYSIVTFLQGQHILNADLGFNKDNVVYFRLKGDMVENYRSVKNELLQHPYISHVTSSKDLPQIISSGELDWGEKNNKRDNFAWFSLVDYDYTETFDILITEGRFFSSKFPADKNDAIIVSETIVKQLNWKDPVGKRFYFTGQYKTIIGVIKDFQCFPMTFIQGGIILELNPGANNYMFIKVDTNDPENYSQTVSFIQSACNRYGNNYPLEIKYLDHYAFEDIEQARAMQNIDLMIFYFAVFGLFVSCLGLLGLSSFMTEKRAKEISVRRVMGASYTAIIRLLTNEYVKIILWANLIALPIAYLVMNEMLQIFAYRIELSWWIFILTGLFVLLIALLTVIGQAIRSASLNPVVLLRYE